MGCLIVMIICPLIDDSECSSEQMFNDELELPSGEAIIVFHPYCSIICRSIIRQSIYCRTYVFSYLLNVVSLFCLSMFCDTSTVFPGFSILVMASFFIHNIPCIISFLIYSHLLKFAEHR